MRQVIPISNRSLARLLVPTAVSVLALAAFAAYPDLVSAAGRYAPWLRPSDVARTGVGAVGLLSLAWLVSRIAEIAITRGMALKGRRPPQLLHELIAAALLLAAAAFGLGSLVEAPLAGVLATSGMLVAMLGFALRKAIADVFSGIALGLERPFRIGDWVEAEAGVAGRVLQMNWRSTRIETRNRVHVVIPNSRLAGDRLTNYSAPQRHYRAQVRVVLDAGVSTARAKQILQAAAAHAPLIRRSIAPDVRVEQFTEHGIAYLVRFWIDDHGIETDCRDAVLSSIDRHLRLAGIALPSPAPACLGPAPQPPTASAEAERALAEIEPFRHLAPQTLRRLAAGSARLVVPAGSPLAAAGVAPGSLIVVLEGTLHAAPGAGGDAGRPMLPGDLVELAGTGSAAEQPGPAQIVARSDAVLLALPKEEVAACKLVDPVLRRALVPGAREMPPCAEAGPEIGKPARLPARSGRRFSLGLPTGARRRGRQASRP